ncbi:disulfide formation protein [Geobacillus subterraneus]|uniref:Disulfide formation protein n=2 Tax=Geobacillus TaxID=129337 RepID=A0ABM6ADR0_9BACL|nr:MULTISPECIES: disulfide oxidoreductase [Geobacillus]AMX84512.1 disulfide formation protein [Geobacillus subterraneus]KZS24722.1 disulfide formation protein [Geobacillus subterraneus]OXB87551.1 disulfide bond formation protein B [Geobacillus uzenensis]QIZ66728.1 disulfide bond formation protein B [Geobacillus subterraneus]WPZ18953.1 disulfide oxidoreductase [Geobacillus subterraneus]
MGKENLLLAAWLTALVATLGSLYFSEVLHFIPCDLCWFQRIFMYPQVIILGIAIARKDFAAARYSLALSLVGGMISLYHYALQKIPFFQDYAISCGRVPCTGQYINWLGFITIPFLALTAFTMIIFLSLAVMRRQQEESER